MAFIDIQTDIVVQPLGSYVELTDKPSINDIALEGNLSLEDLNIQPLGSYVTIDEAADLAQKDLVNVNVGTHNAGKAVYVAEDGTLEFR